jgi:hypothetical protein
MSALPRDVINRPSPFMSPDGLTDVVASFLRDHMRSRVDLHLLVAVSSSEQRWWDDAAVASELFMDRAQARGVLEHLAAHNLLDIRLTEDVRYQFRPAFAQFDNDVRSDRTKAGLRAALELGRWTFADRLSQRPALVREEPHRGPRTRAICAPRL